MGEISLIIDALRSVVTPPCALHEPRISDNEKKYVNECLDSGWVSTAGKFVDQFEIKLAEFTESKYAIATSSGTAALHICLLLSGVKNNDEVILPSLSFIATANAIAYCNAVPHFIDVNERSLGIDPVALDQHLGEVGEIKNGQLINRETLRPIRAVICMHTFGHPVELEALQTVCKEYNLPLIEDAAESLGSLYKNTHTGNFGQVSAFSFNGNKIATAGGGGAIVTNDKKTAELAKHLVTTAKKPHQWEYIHDQIGFNYRMPNINAALACGQLENLPNNLDKKRKLNERYSKAIANISGTKLFQEQDECRSNYWLNLLILDDDKAHLRHDLLKTTNEIGLMCRPAWQPIHISDPYISSPRANLEVTESLYSRIINIPSSPHLVT
jgi:perosamine synthetase